MGCASGIWNGEAAGRPPQILSPFTPLAFWVCLAKTAASSPPAWPTSRH